MLEDDVKRRKEEAATSTRQSSIVDHAVAIPKPDRNVLVYSESNMRNAILEWIIRTNQVCELVKPIPIAQ
jgi:demethoxyubiquinone hydroxylase (CLK1/Coq7/Cat5 family)